MPDFLQIISTYHEINNFPFGENERELAQLIIDNPDKPLLTYHPQGYIRYYFHQLIRNDITLSQFMNLGDVDMMMFEEDATEIHLNPHTYREQHPALLDSITAESVANWTENHIVIIDPLIHAYTLNHSTLTYPYHNYILHSYDDIEQLS